MNTIRHSSEAITNYFKKNAWTLLKTPDSYSDFIDLVKTNLKESNFIQDYHLNDVLLFPFGTVFAENHLYRNGSFVLQDKVSLL